MKFIDLLENWHGIEPTFQKENIPNTTIIKLSYKNKWMRNYCFLNFGTHLSKIYNVIQIVGQRAFIAVDNSQTNPYNLIGLNGEMLLKDVFSIKEDNDLLIIANREIFDKNTFVYNYSDLEGNFLLDEFVRDISPFNKYGQAVIQDIDKNYHIIDRKCNILKTFDADNWYSFYYFETHNFYIANKNGCYTIFNHNFEIIQTFDFNLYRFLNGVFQVYVHHLWYNTVIKDGLIYLA